MFNTPTQLLVCDYLGHCCINFVVVVNREQHNLHLTGKVGLDDLVGVDIPGKLGLECTYQSLESLNNFGTLMYLR